MANGKISGDPVTTSAVGVYMAAIQGGANVQAPSTLFAANQFNLSDLSNPAQALNNLGGLSAALAASTYLTQAAAAAGYQPLDADLTSWAGITRAAGFDAFAATPSSANLASLLTDETGTGANVFANSPTLVTPSLGTPSALVLTNATGLPLGGGGTGQTAAPAALNAVAGVTSTAYGRSLLTAASKAAAGFPYINVVSDYGAVADVVSVNATLSITSGAAVLTAASGGVFTSADVGKSICVPGAGAAGAMLFAQISAFTDATHVTLNANAGTTLTAVASTIRYWTNQATAFQNAINAALALGGAAIFVPRGNYGFDGNVNGSLDPGAGNLAFIGDGRSIFTYYEGQAASQLMLFKNIANTTKGLLYFGPGIRFEGTLDLQGRRAGTPLWLDYYPRILMDGCYWSNIASVAMDFHFCGCVMVTNCHLSDIAADGIRARDTPNCIITNNYIYRNGDDSIALHTLSGTSREGLIVANNRVVNGGTIKILGARVINVVNNQIELGNAAGIQVGFASTEGNLPQRDISITGNTILDLMSIAGGVPVNSTSTAILLFQATAVGQASTHSTRPGFYDATGAAWVYPWTYDEVDTSSGASVIPPVFGVRVFGNTIRRTRPAVGAYSTYGMGTRLAQGVSSDPAIVDANLRVGFGINFSSGSFTDVVVSENIIECATDAIEICQPTYNGQFQSFHIVRNATRDILNRCVNFTSGSFTVDVTIAHNDFDGDTYRQNANSNVNGSYAATGVPQGINSGNITGLKLRHNRFRNCARVLASNLPDSVFAEGNILVGAPVALGFSTSNKGIGDVERGSGRFLWEVIDADPTSATYGLLTNMQLLESAAMPSSGTYVAGAFVRNSVPAIGTALEGWSRLTTGTAHVLNTDWLPVTTNLPASDDGAALGSTSLKWSDLFLASGAVLNFNSGNYTVTHSAGALVASGSLTVNSTLLGLGFIGTNAPAGNIGFTTGAGGAVTQITSRTTGVTLNTPSGAITMFSAAGSATAASFTVTNSRVAATDVISLSVKTATNKYVCVVTAVAAGSFEITFFTTGGTSVDAPVINFDVFKGAAS